MVFAHVGAQQDERVTVTCRSNKAHTKALFFSLCVFLS